MIDFVLTALAILAVLVIAGWPWIKVKLAGLSVVPLWQAQILVFRRPRADSSAEVFTFTGLNFGVRFFGMVTSREAVQAPAVPVEKPRIVMPD